MAKLADRYDVILHHEAVCPVCGVDGIERADLGKQSPILMERIYGFCGCKLENGVEVKHWAELKPRRKDEERGNTMQCEYCDCATLERLGSYSSTFYYKVCPKCGAVAITEEVRTYKTKWIHGPLREGMEDASEKEKR